MEKKILDLVLQCLREVLMESDDDNAADLESLNESTRLLGKQSILDSLSLVTLIVSIEQKLSEQYGVTVTIADERALSQEKSPFRTAGTLSKYAMLLIDERSGHART
jgi:acyl carrier protein